MNGLYQRAEQIYRQKNRLRLVSKGEGDGAMENIPAEERDTILHEIDVILAKNRVQVESSIPSGGRSGVGLPVIANLVILAVVATAVLLFTRGLNGEESRLATGARTILGAENQVVDAIRQESAAQLGQKDKEIVSFQKRLDEASQESERLKVQTAAAIQKRTAELAAEMKASLEAERARLQKAGLDQVALDARLGQYENGLKVETAKQAEAFRKKAEEDAARNQAAADALVAEYQRSLNQAQDDRSKLQQQYQSREADLKRQYDAESKAAQAEKGQALAELGRIQDLQRQEGLVMGSILSAYNGINRQIQDGDNDGALKSLASLRASLDREPAVSLAAIRDRRPVELFIIGSLEELVRDRIDSNRGDAAALIEAQARITALRDKAAQAEKLYQQKDYAGAKSLYLSALGEIPEARTGAERLSALSLMDAKAEAEAARRSGRESVAQGTSLARDGQWQATLDHYRAALGMLLGDGVAANALVAQVSEAGYRLGLAGETPRGTLVSDRIESMKTALEKQGADPAPGLGAGDTQVEDVAALLQAKLLLWQIIGSDPIKTKYPELYGTMQKYFDTFASQQRQEGRDAALRDVIALIESLKKGETSVGVPAAVSAAVPATFAADRSSTIKLLEGLEGLLRE